METRIYQRKLPHIQPAEATFFITIRLEGSMPSDDIRRVQENHTRFKQGLLNWNDLTPKEKFEIDLASQEKWFVLNDDLLDHNPNGPYWLKEKEIADIVAESFHYRDGTQYELHGYTIMPNHVHLMVTLLPEAHVLHKVMQHMKRVSAKRCNKILNRTGLTFWDDESYDRIVRSENEFFNILNYILRNPVKAKLVKSWKDWPYTYIQPELL
jgi:putative transposase